ncbi:MAG TPA: lipase family protein [Terriglobales bacterium]|nr:lipase family protein [Terriglobales bacterium]
MDLNRAIQFGLLVKAAEAVAPSNTANAAGKTIPAMYDPNNIGYKVVTTIYGNDLATDMNPGRGNQIVSFGFILQAPNNDVVIAIRGTEGIWEWIHDAEFLTVKCPFLAGAGSTEDGFTAIDNSLRVDVATTSARVVDAVAALPFNQATNSLTICGHSLGGALATLLALDVASNTSFKNPTIYTYASPRTGDPLFVSTYNQVVPNTCRIANRVDLVPKLPLPPVYEHVLGLYELSSVKLMPIPTFLVKFDLACEHHMTSYLYLLSLLAGGAVQPLNAECVP